MQPIDYIWCLWILSLCTSLFGAVAIHLHMKLKYR